MPETLYPVSNCSLEQNQELYLEDESSPLPSISPDELSLDISEINSSENEIHPYDGLSDPECVSEVTSRRPYKNINPSELKLVVITSCNCNLNSNINIGVIYQCLEIDDLVKTIELENNTKGELKIVKNVRKNKKHIPKDKKKKHFINQITIVLNYKGSKINVKLFGNGKMVITGAKSTKVLKEALGLLVEKVRNLSIETKIIEPHTRPKLVTRSTSVEPTSVEPTSVDLEPESTSILSDFFTTTSEFIKFLEKNHLIMLDLVNTLDLDFPLDWHKILINREKNKLLERELDLETFITTELFTSYHPELESITHKLVQTVKLVKNYSYSLLNPLIVEDAIKFYLGDPINLITSYEQLPLPENLSVTVNNYNAMFESNVKFDREKFHQILTHQCGILVNYRPSSYQGLNITYFLNHEGERESVTFFVFQEGTIMITGNKKWEVVEQSYREMCQIIDNYYENIVNTGQYDRIRKNVPSKIEKEDDGKTCVFLNRKTVINNHPRNNYLLKTKGLMSLFTPITVTV